MKVIKYDYFNNINSSSSRAWSIYFFEPSLWLLSFTHSVMSDSLQPQAARQASPSFTMSQSLLQFMSIELVIPYNYPILCLPLLFPLSVFPSIRVFSSESGLCIRWPKCLSFSFSINLSSEYSGLTSFRLDLVGS